MLNDVTTLWILLLLSVVLGLIGWVGLNFLGRELLKKFQYDDAYLNASGHKLSWRYEGARTIGGPKMWNIVLVADRPFTAKIGFLLTLRGFWLKVVSLLTTHDWGQVYSAVDWYGQYAAEQRADGQWSIVFSTYAGHGGVEFLLESSIPASEVVLETGKGAQAFEPHVAYPPHWYQEVFDNFWD